MLIIARPDGEYTKVRRRGVTAIDRDRADDPQHLAAAIDYAKKRMIFGLAQKGYEYVDEAEARDANGHQYAGWEVRGPQPHIEFSEDTRPDPGPQTPVPNLDRLREQERQERDHTARAFDLEGKELVDYELVASFLRRVQSAPVFI